MRDERVTYVAGHPLYKTLVGGVAQWLDSRSVAGRLYLHDLRVIYGSNVIGGFRGGGGRASSGSPFGRRTDAVTHGTPDTIAILSLQTRKTWYSPDYSKFLPPVAF